MCPCYSCGMRGTTFNSNICHCEVTREFTLHRCTRLPILSEVMNFATSLSNPPSELVLRQAESVIQAWGLRMKVSETVVCRLVRCFDSKYLLSLPRPAGFKVGKFSTPQIHRYLWYRQAAKALGWRDRQKFPAQIEELLKVLVWPDGEAEMHDSCSAIDCRNNTQQSHSGGFAAGRGHGAVGHVSRDARERGHAVDTHNTLGAREGSAWEDQHSIVRPSYTSSDELCSNRTIQSGDASGGSEPADSAVDHTCNIAGKRARPWSTSHSTQSHAEEFRNHPSSDDRDGEGWDAKRSQLEHSETGDSK